MLIMGASRRYRCSWYSSFRFSVCLTFFGKGEKHIYIFCIYTDCKLHEHRTDVLFTLGSQSVARRPSSWKELQIITERRNEGRKERGKGGENEERKGRGGSKKKRRKAGRPSLVPALRNNQQPHAAERRPGLPRHADKPISKSAALVEPSSFRTKSALGIVHILMQEETEAQTQGD